MSELSKQALKVQNNTEFPNNNAGLITPSKLRGFNTDMIDSLVDEISYNVDSASWNQQIDSLEGFTASLATNFVNTASFNAYTQSNDQKWSTLQSFTASITASVQELLNLSSSLSGGYVTQGELADATGSLINSINTKLNTSSFNSYTASTDSSISQLNASSASQQISINALNANSASANSSITNLNSATASLFTSASLGLTTASFASQTLTFTKGDGSTFGILIPDVSGSAGNFVTTSSFNAYTASNDQRVSSLQSATASLFTSASNALVTASVSGQLLSFTKGNNSVFSVNLPTGSGTIVTGSYGAFQDSTTQSGSANIAYKFKFNTTDISDGVILSGSTGLQVGAYGTYNLQWSGQAVQGSGAGIVSVWVNVNGIQVSGSRGDVTLPSNTKLLPAWNYFLTLNALDVVELYWASDSGNTTWQALPIGTTPTSPAAASIIATLARVDVGGGTNSVSTSSFNAYTSSNDQKVNSLIAATGSYATTGSNTFNGNQTVNGGISGSGLQIHSAVNLGSTAYLRFESGSGGSDFYNIQLVPGDGSMAFSRNGASNVKVLTLAGSSGQKTIFQNNEVQFSSNVPQVTFDAPIAIGTSIVTPVLITGSITTTGYANIGGALSASLPQGYVWVGDASNRTAVFPTSSFGSTLPSGVISGSQQITALGFVSSSITGSSLVTASVAVNVITFTKGDSSTFDITVSASGSVTPGTISGSQQITDLGFVSSSVTASSLVTASFSGNTLTFTKGDASTFGVVIPDVSGSGTAFANPSVESISGSLLITANTFTSGAANLLHLTASAQNQSNLVFKDNNLSGSTIISGSNNIFTNPATAGVGRINYIGGASNLFLNGQSDQLPTITGSAASVSGNRPTMNANFIPGTSAWTINQSVNPGTHTYSNNILGGNSNWTFNMLGNTGTVQVSNNLGLTSAMTLNSPSRSIAEINAGASGSNALTITNNTLAGTFNYNGPISSSTNLIQQNSIAGTLTMNVQSQSRGVSFSANIINGTLTVNDNTNFSPTLGSTPTISNNNINGTITVTNRASASINLSANNLNGFTITNEYDSSTNGTNGRQFALQGNALLGFIGNNVYFSGSAAGTGTTNDRGRGLYGNLLGGSRISASVTGDGNRNLIASAIIGHGLNIYGTSLYDASNAANAGGQNGGSAFFGRWNAEDGNRANSSETVFAVGTGNSGSAGIVRKTGFLIDSGSNTFVEGTLNVSGATSLNGDLVITGSLTASLQQGYVWVGDASGKTTTVATSSFGGGGAAFPFTGNAVITGSLGISGSMFGGVIALSVVSTTASVDFSAANMFTLSLPSASTHINPTNIRAGQTVNIQITQPTPGTGSVTFPSNVKFAGGNDYQATTTGSAIDMLTLVSYDGTNVLATSIKNFL